MCLCEMMQQYQLFCLQHYRLFCLRAPQGVLGSRENGARNTSRERYCIFDEYVYIFQDRIFSQSTHVGYSRIICLSSLSMLTIVLVNFFYSSGLHHHGCLFSGCCGPNQPRGMMVLDGILRF